MLYVYNFVYTIVIKPIRELRFWQITNDHAQGIAFGLSSGPPACSCWTSVPQRFIVGLVVEYSSCFISVLNLDLYIFTVLI